MPFTHADITRLREQFWQAEAAYQNHQILVKERERYEKAIQMLSQQIERQCDHVYRQSFRIQDRADSKRQEEQLYNNKEQLQQLKHKQREIDLLLDASEELTPHALFALKVDLLECIWAVHADQREEWEGKWKDLQNQTLFESELIQLKIRFIQVQDCLYKAIEKRQSIKGKGLLHYIFGISPNAVIEGQLRHCSSLISELLPNLQQALLHASPFHLLLLEMEKISKNLNEQCKASWSFKHIDTYIQASYQSIQTSIQALDLYLNSVQKKKEALTQELKEWLETVVES
ncbi:hypothetical protein [Candidatus Protochlamydia phocaeensis]|uniref:hypothetical protein n=1 Tax=Candidatus Protochlamydia phocaeensis TaxID=1414722 RepID=UPI000837E012|nr:hypothetical protein [Candidatus Protochlamydia phocaeensis]